MRHVLYAAAAALLGSAALASSALAAPPPASLSAISCHSTLTPAARSVSVTSTMRHLPRTRQLQVRFSLRETASGAAPRTVHDGDLGRWLTPSDRSLGRRPADVWKLTKAVYNVDAPARYRFVVSFRWVGRDGTVLTTRRLRTESCGERELRPDLLVAGVSVRDDAGHPGLERYVATIANRGLTASGPFAVTLTPGGGGAVQFASISTLGPGARRRVVFVSARCDAADPPTVIADPGDQVDDDNRSNNALTVPCPVGADGAEVD